MGRLAPASLLEVAVPELRDPEPQDAWFVVDLLVQGAQGGFFNPHLAQPAMLLALVQQLQMMTSTHQMLTPDGRIWSRLFMLSLGRQTLGFIWLCEEGPQGAGGAIEIAAISIMPGRRGQGFGDRLLDGVIDYVREEFPERDIFARCRPASARMQAMLRNRGFLVAGSNCDSIEMRLAHASAAGTAAPATPDSGQ